MFDPSAIARAFESLFDLGVQLSPALVQWIEAKIPAEKQAIITRRMRRCKRICKHNNLFSPGLVSAQVDILFLDFSIDQRKEISTILTAELQPKHK